MHFLHRFLPIFILLGILTPPASFGQDEPVETLKVFLDCRRCDFDYIRREVSYVDYVRDRKDADVHVLVTTERTGSGGNEYRLTFIGLKEFSALTDTLTYASSSTDTQDEVRAGLTRRLENGLYRYVVRTEMADQLDISVNGRAERAVETSNPEDDPWNSWIFNLGINGSYSEEETSNFLRTNGSFNAARITEDWKFRFNVRSNYRESNFKVGDEIITSTTEDGNIWALLVKSLGTHWSTGGSFFVNTSSRQNRKLYASISPAIEFNIFPYSESDLREIRVVYTLAYQNVEYEEVTIYDKIKEQLVQQRLNINLDFRQPWGSASMGIEGRNYLTDFEGSRFDLYSVEFDGSINVRLIRGLNLNFGGSIELIRDQLYLPKEEATEDEILLQTIRLPTNYEFNVSFGFNYLFGSIYNNVVNPRFGF